MLVFTQVQNTHKFLSYRLILVKTLTPLKLQKPVLLPPSLFPLKLLSSNIHYYAKLIPRWHQTASTLNEMDKLTTILKNDHCTMLLNSIFTILSIYTLKVKYKYLQSCSACISLTIYYLHNSEHAHIQNSELKSAATWCLYESHVLRLAVRTS